MTDKKTNNEYIFTFATCHRRYGISLGNSYVLINAPTMSEARKIMFEQHDDKWAFAYESKEKAGVEEFNLVLFAQYDYMEDDNERK